MRAVRHFTVVPAIPPALESLREVATNLHWTWDRETKHLFDRLDPVQWAASGHDPLRLLASIEVVCGFMLLLFGVSELLEYTREHRDEDGKPRRAARR